MKKVALALVLLAAIACNEFRDPLGGSDSPLVEYSLTPGTHRFIVELARGSDPRQIAREHGVQPQVVYSRLLNGFAGEISELARSGLMRDVRVVRLEQDLPVAASSPVPAASWGLDRIDQRATPLDGTYRYDATGTGVTAYIVDTGIRYTHQEFEGRASFGFDALGGNGVDCNGHGTHVAGTIGGRTYGVARGVSLVGVRVLDCNGSGTVSGVIAGLDWVASHASGAAVVNMSLGSAVSASFDDAVRRLISLGIPVVVAAGNSAADACDYSPARVANAITVGAADVTDTRASFSNYGACLDWFAPGVGIKSAWGTDDGAVAVLNGTSMAAPHTAGTAALVLEAEPWLSPQAVRDSLWSHATKNVVKQSFSATAHLLYSLNAYDPDLSNPPPSTLPKAPTDLTAGASTSNVAVSLSWKQNDPNAEKVEIYWRKASEYWDWTRMVSGPATFKSVTLTDQELTAGTTYEFTVRIKTLYGMYSDYAASAVARTCDASGNGTKCSSGSDGGTGGSSPGGAKGGGKGKKS